jgi:hypothetical protein
LLIGVRRHAHAVKRQQAQNMPYGHAGLAAFDATNGLHVHTQPRGGGSLAFARGQTGLLGSGAQGLDALQCRFGNVGGDSLALGHAAIVTRPRRGA